MTDSAPPDSTLPPPVVVFDLDGTLTDSATGILHGYRHALAVIGEPEPDPALLDRVVGPPMIENFRRLGVRGDRLDHAVAAYFELYDDGGGWAENAVYGGIESLLADLVARGVRLGVATSKKQRLAVRILDHFGLAPYFDYIGGASDDLTRRSKIDVVAHTLAHLGIDPVPGDTRGIVMVGDREHDVEGAAHWGIPTIYAGWGYGVAGESDDAAWVATTVADLRARLLPRSVHVSFVCTGNICRSPMAEKIFAAHVERAGLGDRVRVSSAGTGDWHIGNPADERTVALLRRSGYASDHTAAVVSDDHQGADLVVALDRGHERELARLGVPSRRRRLLRSFDPDADGPDVPDPYYGDDADFEEVRAQIEAAVPGLLTWVREQLDATVDTCDD